MGRSLMAIDPIERAGGGPGGSAPPYQPRRHPLRPRGGAADAHAGRARIRTHGGKRNDRASFGDELPGPEPGGLAPKDRSAASRLAARPAGGWDHPRAGLTRLLLER